MRRGRDISVIVLNITTLLAAAGTLVLPGTPESTVGVFALAALVCWTLFRLATRSRALSFRIIDFCYVLVVAASLPVFGTDPTLVYTISVPQVVAGTAVIACGVALRPRYSWMPALTIAAAFAWGCAQIVGWQQVAAIPALYYMLVQWVITSAVLLTSLRVARRVDQTRADNHDAALQDAISAAVRDHELEHMALVHDTAASTLYLVGAGADVSTERIAAQARRDLELLANVPAPLDPHTKVDVVAAIRSETAHVATHVRILGLSELILGSRTAHAIVAVVREALNNAERHARAAHIGIDITPTQVTVTDDGVGFDPHTATLGHGLSESIVGRMRRAHGTATVVSAPGEGTVVTVNWNQLEDTGPVDHAPTVDDVDRLTERFLIGFGLGLVALALAVLLVSMPHAVNTEHGGAQIGLAALAAVVALAGIPRVLGRGPNFTVPALILMAVVVAVQGYLLPADILGGPAQWTLVATGLCILPYLLRLRLGAAVGVMTVFWVTILVLNFERDPTMDTAYNLTLCTAAIAFVQMCVLAFPVVLRRANAEAADDIRARWEADAQRRISDALHDDYVRRTSKLIRGVFPLLQTLSTGTIDAEIRWRARIESRRLKLYIFQSRTFSHPLLAGLRPTIEEADRRGVVVTLQADDNLPVLEAAERDRVLAPIRSLLTHAVGQARVGLTVVPGELVASIIADIGDTGVVPEADPGRPRLEVTTIGNKAWVSVHYTLPTSGATSHQRADIA